jgi:hypothetical protein
MNKNNKLSPVNHKDIKEDFIPCGFKHCRNNYSKIQNILRFPRATMSFKLLIAALPALALACIGPPTNQNGLNLIKSFESFQPNEYDDGFGNPTIGYGHLCTDTSCSDVSFPKPLTEDTAQQLLSQDLLVGWLQLSDHEVRDLTNNNIRVTKTL